MIADRIENDSDALRELAGWILRDGIDCDHLENYMRALLAKHLVELSASCRYGAMKAIECCTGLGSMGVAGYFCEMATRIDSRSSPIGQSSFQSCDRSTAFGSAPARNSDLDVSVSSDRFSRLPELIAAVAFTTVGLLLIPADGGDVTLRALAASLYLAIGFIHAGVAIHSAWRNAHAKHMKLRSVR
jgi:hypothetical protein